MKNRFLFLIPLLSLSLLLLSSSVSCNRTGQSKRSGNGSEPSDSLKTVLIDEVNRYYADMSKRDWKAYASHFWPGAHLSTVWQPPGADSLQVMMTTIEEFIEQADQGPGSQPIFEEKMLDAEIKVYDNLASVWATYAAKFGSEDSLTEWKGIDAFTYMKHNGEWHIVSLAYTQLHSP